MRIRSLSQLDEFIDSDLARRKRSLTCLKFLFENSRAHEKEIVASAGLCFLYSHWEGFVKYSGMCYTNYVSVQGLEYRSLSNGIVAICVRSKLKGLRSTNKVSINREFVELLRDCGSEKPVIPWKSAIETYDNLNSEVLKEILSIVGCDPSPYATRFNFIDEKLLKFRNALAHNGYDHDFEVSDFPMLYTGVLALLEQFRNDVQDAAFNKAYTA